MKILLVVGARPNFMKMAPLYFEMKKSNHFTPIIVHTGQHYDYEMSQAFFEDLLLPEPDYFLNAGSGTHAEQTSKIMLEFERIVLQIKPSLVVVFGDVNSTLACSITAKKLHIPIAHVEAGLRSYDETMPEEINRKLTDAISDILFTPSKDANKNLLREGIKEDKIFFVGNIMIDSLSKIIENLDNEKEETVLAKFRVLPKSYCLVTLHRPLNVDSEEILRSIIETLLDISNKLKLIFPIHPRTKKNLERFGINTNFNNNSIITETLRYTDFITLEKNAFFSITDSGGIQEETTYLGIPCLTLRPNTERPITIKEGTNELVSLENFENKVEDAILGKYKNGKIPHLWDGKTSTRIVEIIEKWIS